MKTYYWLNRNRFLSHLRTSFCALAVIGSLLTLPTAEASAPEPASGEFFPCFTYAGPPRQVGDNAIVTFNVTTTADWHPRSDLLEGTELDVVHRDGSINASWQRPQAPTNSGTLVSTSFRGVYENLS